MLLYELVMTVYKYMVYVHIGGSFGDRRSLARRTSVGTAFGDKTEDKHCLLALRAHKWWGQMLGTSGETNI